MQKINHAALFTTAACEFKNFIIGDGEDIFNQNDFIGIKVPLTHLDFCECTPGDVTSAHLHSRRYLLLC